MFSIKKINTRFFAALVSVMVVLAAIFSLSSSSSVNAGDITMKYMVYNASTGTYLREYSLTVEGNNARTPIDNDEREIDYSKNGVVKIICGNRTFGTGFVVDDHTIATAAHCLKFMSIDSILLFDQNGNISMTITDPVEFHFPRKYLYSNTQEERDLYDYALITVKQSLKEYQCFGFGMITKEFPGNGTSTASLTGFPEIVNGKTVNSAYEHMMYRGTGSIKYLEPQNSDDIKMIFYTNDSSTANSGGPLFITEQHEGKLYHTVIGIHVQNTQNIYHKDCNGSIALSPVVLKFLRGNNNKNF